MGNSVPRLPHMLGTLSIPSSKSLLMNIVYFFCFVLLMDSMEVVTGKCWLPGLGWSLYTSYSWRTIEVEICLSEFSWFSFWGSILIHHLISYGIGISLPMSLISYSSLLCSQLICSCLSWQVDGDREMLFLFERGKKKLLEGNRVEFTGQKILTCLCPLSMFIDIIFFSCFILFVF